MTPQTHPRARQAPHMSGSTTSDKHSVEGQRACRLLRSETNCKPLLGCRNVEAVRRDLEAARSEIMGPLSAASMESHSRAYPHLVQLHMLQVK